MILIKKQKNKRKIIYKRKNHNKEMKKLNIKKKK